MRLLPYLGLWGAEARVLEERFGEQYRQYKPPRSFEHARRVYLSLLSGGFSLVFFFVPA